MLDARRSRIISDLALVAATIALWGTALDAGSGPLTPRLLTPPDAPDTIVGPDILFPNQSGLFTVTAADPDTDSLYIIVFPDMGDTTRNVEFGPLPSGTPMTFGMAWDSNATFTMRARARDIGGETSPLSPAKRIVVSPARIAWQFQTIDGDGFYSSPAVNVDSFGDTLVYIGCDDTRFYSFVARTGGIRGTFQSLNVDAFSASPAISADGRRVYIADEGGWLYCLSASNLARLSRYPPSDTWIPGMQPFFSTPAVFGNAVYLGRDDGYFYWFDDNDGQLTYRASHNVFADISSSPAIDVTGHRIVVGNDSGYVNCFNDSLGLVWRRLLGGRVVASPALSPDGVVYVGCNDESLYSLRITDGSDVFPPFSAGRPVVSSPVVGSDSTVYIATDSGTVYAVRQGVELWQTTLPFHDPITATPCLAPDTTLLINTNWGTAYALDVRPYAPEPGKVLYRVEWPEPPVQARSGRRKSAALSSSPTIGPGSGLVYAGSPNGGFFAMSVNRPGFQNGRLPDAPWPKFHHDIQNRGVQTIPSGIGEQPPVLLDAPRQSATVVRGVLELAPGKPGQSTTVFLLDISGRKVLELHPGPNDVSQLVAGVYFVRDLGSEVRGRGEVRKVVIAR